MNILTVLEIWAAGGPVAGFFACKYLPRVKPIAAAVVEAASEISKALDEPCDEFLIEQDGAFIPLKPPEYVPAGQNPVAASRARSRAEGRTYHTRRIGE